jgi:cell division protein FtsB
LEQFGINFKFQKARQLRSDNEKLKTENMALVRVLAKMSSK